MKEFADNKLRARSGFAGTWDRRLKLTYGGLDKNAWKCGQSIIKPSYL